VQRRDTIGLFRRRTALQGALVQTEFDTTKFNATYDELFGHLRNDIVDAVQSQIQQNG